MIQQLSVVAAIVGIWLFFRWVRKQPRQKKIQSILIIAAIVLLGLVITGKLHGLFAIFAAILPLLQKAFSLLIYTPLLGRLFTQFSNTTRPGSGANQSSSVETEYLSMKLDHATGVMSGSVKKGKHTGKHLDDLSITELAVMYEEFLRVDADSAQLLEAYLDRTYKDTWKEHIDEQAHTEQRAAKSSPMTTDEARSILGVNDHATSKEIIEAHRRLMQKLHPDRGGNDYLASKINQAKDCLLRNTA